MGFTCGSDPSNSNRKHVRQAQARRGNLFRQDQAEEDRDQGEERSSLARNHRPGEEGRVMSSFQPSLPPAHHLLPTPSIAFLSLQMLFFLFSCITL